MSIHRLFTSGPAAAADDCASPCISVCKMDPATGWCQGCLRTIDEIARWSALSHAEKRAVLAELARRRGRIGQDGAR